MVINEDGEYKSMSEGEMESLQHVARHQHVNQEDDQVLCDNDASPALVVSS